MYELGMYDKLSKNFRLSKEEFHRIEMTKKAVKFCDTLEKKEYNMIIVSDIKKRLVVLIIVDGMII